MPTKIRSARRAAVCLGRNPELVKHVDYIAVHLLPYWSYSVDESLKYIVNSIEELKQLYPTSHRYREVGWPSNGRTRKEAVASEANEPSSCAGSWKSPRKRNTSTTS